MSSAPHSAPIWPSILLAVRPESATENPYIALLAGSVAADAHIKYFRWKTALFGKYDVVHLHWPESLIFGRSRTGRTLKGILSLAFIARIRLLRIPVVRTLHNESPHETQGHLARLISRMWNASTSEWIVLNRHTRAPIVGANCTLIPHGHYRDWYEEMPPRALVSTTPQLLFFGLIRKYKGLSALVSAVSDMPGRSVRLVIAGRADDPATATLIRESAAKDSRITAHFGYVPDEHLRRLLDQSDIVVLPYSNTGNSGAALLALSMNRAVMLPRGPVTEDLQQEFGGAYVHVYDPPLNRQKLASLISDWQERASERTRLGMANRDWMVTGKQHLDVYRRATAPAHR